MRDTSTMRLLLTAISLTLLYGCASSGRWHMVGSGADATLLDTQTGDTWIRSYTPTNPNSNKPSTVYWLKLTRSDTTMPSNDRQ
jgi:hypothetical protein